MIGNGWYVECTDPLDGTENVKVTPCVGYFATEAEALDAAADREREGYADVHVCYYDPFEDHEARCP